LTLQDLLDLRALIVGKIKWGGVVFCEIGGGML